MAAVTYHHKCGSLTHRYLSSHSSGSQKSKSECRQGHACSEGSEGASFPSLPTFHEFPAMVSLACELSTPIFVPSSHDLLSESLCGCSSSHKDTKSSMTSSRDPSLHLQRLIPQIRSHSQIKALDVECVFSGPLFNLLRSYYQE